MALRLAFFGFMAAVAALGALSLYAWLHRTVELLGGQ